MRINQTSGGAPNVGQINSNKASKTSKSFEVKESEAQKGIDGIETKSAFLEDVKTLAQQMRDGLIGKEDAAQMFAKMVVEQRHNLKVFGKKAEQITKAVQETVGQDPEFTQRLQTQLSKLNQKV